jgi:uncharacterized protein YbjT (DUF2867 family)
MAQRTALVAGASGLVGGQLLQVLLENPAYGRVTALVRRPLPLSHPRLEQRAVDFDRLAEQAGAFQVDDVFCCLGTTIKKAGSQAAFRKVDYEYPVAMAQLAHQQDARQYLIVTAMGADARSRIFYNRVKGEVEQAVRSVGLPAVHVFRPSLLLGERQEARFGERVATVVSKAVTPLMGGGLRKYRPIAGRAVAEAMCRAALSGAAPGLHIYESDRIADLARG